MHPSLHIQLAIVGDRADARRFYVDGLRLDVLGEQRRGLVVGHRAPPPVMLVLVTPADAETARQRVLIEGLVAAQGAGPIELPSDDCAAAHQRLRSLGEGFVGRPDADENGLPRLAVRDPWGNRLQIFQRTR